MINFIGLKILSFNDELVNSFIEDVRIREDFFNFKKIGLLKFRCSKCNKLITVNGATSHSKVCGESVIKDKLIFIKKYFHLKENCSFCDSKIIYSPELRFNLGNRICFCSEDCLLNSKKIISFNNSKIYCTVCNHPVINFERGDTCSLEHSKIKHKESLVKYHKESVGTKEYDERNLKIRQNSIGKHNNSVAWNKGLSGKKYLDHYEKPDGTNSLYEGLKKNDGWFKKTEPEKIFEELLIKLNIRYQYSFFFCQKQFDFLLSLEKQVIIFEIDGDYWHKSKRIFPNKEDRLQKRQDDLEKEQILYNHIKNTSKSWKILRFWEYDVLVNRDFIETILIKLKNAENKEEFKNIFSEVKKHYSINA